MSNPSDETTLLTLIELGSQPNSDIPRFKQFFYEMWVMPLNTKESVIRDIASDLNRKISDGELRERLRRYLDLLRNV